MVLLCPFLGVACLWDYSERRIPNLIPFVIFGMGLIYRYCFFGWKGVGDLAISIVLVTFILFPLFRFGMLGGGDVKLIASAAGFFSGKETFIFVISVFLISAVPALVKIIITKSIRERFGYLSGYVQRSVADRKARVYLNNREEKKRAGIALSGPILMSAILHWGGVY